jgi:hypothetical protein
MNLYLDDVVVYLDLLVQVFTMLWKGKTGVCHGGNAGKMERHSRY